MDEQLITVAQANPRSFALILVRGLVLVVEVVCHFCFCCCCCYQLDAKQHQPGERVPSTRPAGQSESGVGRLILMTDVSGPRVFSKAG